MQFTQTNNNAGDVNNITIAGILDVVDKFRAIPKPKYNAFVCLPSALEALHNKCLATPPSAAPLDTLFGIPVYEAADDNEAKMIYLELLGQGKRPVILRGSTLPASPEPFLYDGIKLRQVGMLCGKPVVVKEWVDELRSDQSTIVEDAPR